MRVKDEKLIKFLDSIPAVKWGIADITGLHPLAGDFEKAVSIVFPYMQGFQVYDEEKYFEASTENKKFIKETVDALRSFLEEEGIRYAIPEGRDPAAGPFPYKLAAVRAALGWIGKSTLLVTKSDGPRVRLATILLDTELPGRTIMDEWGCKNCHECVSACPNHCIKDVRWQENQETEPVFDSIACRKDGHPRIEKLDRNFSCGVCVFSCPYGKQQNRNKKTTVA